MFLKNYFFQNFRGCVLLFSYQGSCQFLTAQIFYHIVLCLSRTFLNFLFFLTVTLSRQLCYSIMCFSVCQALFSFFFAMFFCTARNSPIIARHLLFVNPFFTFFPFFTLQTSNKHFRMQTGFRMQRSGASLFIKNPGKREACPKAASVSPDF